MKGQSIFGWYSNYTADSVIRYVHVYVPRPDRASLSPLFWNNFNERSQSNAVQQAACRVCTLRMHAYSGAGTRAVPYRTRHGTTVCKSWIGHCKTFLNQCSIYGSVIVKHFIAEINVRFMDRSLNVCKTFYNRNQCLIYGSVIECL